MTNWCENILTVYGPSNELNDFRELNRGPTRTEAKALSLAFSAKVPIPPLMPEWSPLEVPNLFWNRHGEELMLGTECFRPRNVLRLADDPDDWCREHWGTRFEPFDVSVQRGDAQLEYTFLTAWNPPDLWLTRVAAQHPMLSFQLDSLDTTSPEAQRLRIIRGVVSDKRSSVAGEISARAMAIERFGYSEEDVGHL